MAVLDDPLVGMHLAPAEQPGAAVGFGIEKGVQLGARRQVDHHQGAHARGAVVRPQRPGFEARAASGLARVYAKLGRYADAVAALRSAAALARA